MDTDSEIFNENWQLMHKELSGESERACAIVGVAYLDDYLGQVLQQYLLEHANAYNELLGSENLNAPLSSFGARIIISYGMGLISEADMEALRRLKKIRNRFAHSLKMSFEDDEVKSHCQTLKGLVEDLFYLSEPPSPRDVFQSVVANYSGRLSEKLRIMKESDVSGSFGSVIRMSAALSEARQPKKPAG